LPVTAQAGFSQLIKGGELMLHQNALQAARISELEEQLAVMTKRKTRKRKQIQHGGTIESKKARGGGDQERAQLTVRRCGNCGGTGHNACTCKKDTEDNSESELSSICTDQWVNCDEIEDA
jgi:hypothetical protein